jgi:hypothetical protein
VTSEIQDQLQIFQGCCPRFSMVPLNKKCVSHLPRPVYSFLCTKAELFTFSICNIQPPNKYGSQSFMQSLMSECVALF